MANLVSQLIVRLVDQVSKPARQVAASVKGLVRTVTDADGATGRSVRGLASRNRRELQAMKGELLGAGATAFAFAKALGAPIKAARDFESAMSDVRKVVNFDNPQQFKQMGEDLRKMSERIPIAVSGLAEIAAAAGQAGIDRSEILAFTEAAATVGVAFDISADKAGDALAHLRTGLGLTTPQTLSLADAMNQLSNVQASTAADILEVTERVGPQAKQFGLAGEQVAALASAMLSAGNAPDVVATSLRNLGLALTKGDAATKRNRIAYKALGLDAVETAKRMQTQAIPTIIDVLDRLNKKPAYQRAALSSQLFGNEAHALGPIITNMKLLHESLGIVAKQTNYAGSATNEYTIRSKTSANRQELFNAALKNLSITVGTILLPVIDGLNSSLTPLVHAITAATGAMPGFVRWAAIAASAVVAFRLASVAGKYGVLQFKAGLLDMAQGYVFLVGKAKWAAGLVTLPFRRAREEAELSMALQRLATRGASPLGAAYAAEGTAAAATMATGWRRMLAPIGAVRAAILGVKLTLRGLLIGSGIGLLILAAGFIIENWSGVKAFFVGFGKGFMEAIGPLRPALEPLIRGVKVIAGAIGRLIGPVDASGKGWASWGERLGKAVGGGVLFVVQGVGRIVGFIRSIPGRILSGLAALPGLLGRLALRAIVAYLVSWYELPGQLRSIAAQIVPAIGNALGFGAGFLVGMGLRLSRAILRGIVRGAVGIARWAMAFPGQLLAFIEGLPAAMLKLGGLVIQSFLDGLKAEAQALIAFVRGLADAVTLPFKLAGKVIDDAKGKGGPASAGQRPAPGAPAAPDRAPVRTGFNAGLAAAAGLPRRARGGPLAAGQAFIGAEEGPEIFAPGKSGTVYPNREVRRLARAQADAVTDAAAAIGRPAPVPARGPVSLAVHIGPGAVQISGVRDGAAAADRAVSKLADKVAEKLRGAFADHDLGVA